MKVGVHIPSFTTAQPENFADDIKAVVQAIDRAGFSLLTVMDHYFQIPHVGEIKEPMNEAYTMLGHFAALTKQVRLSAMVTGVIYRNPGFLVKQVTALDVLSKGRANLGIGAGWFEREAQGLGFNFPSLKERFERLEETLQIAKQMWSDNDGPYNGKHYQMKETICVPKPLQKPHPPILIGGSGEKKTLRFVAKYANACNLFARGGYDVVEHKINVLKKHCQNEGRDFNEIMVTSQGRIGEDLNTSAILENLKKLHELGVEHAHFSFSDLYSMKGIELFENEIIPTISDW